jgi:hypothetical protein
LRPLLPFLAILLGGCPAAPKCKAGFIGDPAQPPQAIMVYTDGVSPKITDVQPNQAIPLEPPIQGGYVMYLAARVLNMSPCVSFAGNLIDPDTLDQVGYDCHGSTPLVMHDDGYGYPSASSLANFANVNGCPDFFDKDVQARTYTLELTVTDKDGRQAVATQPIVPTCMLTDPATQSDCICQCSANNVLGKCSGDAGTTD